MATTAQSIRSFLDSLSQLPGSILYRSDLNWKGLPPGEAGQFLVLDETGMPAWATLNAYQPAMYQFDGATTQLQRTGITTTNGPITVPFRFSTPPTAGAPRIWNMHTPQGEREQTLLDGSGRIRIIIRGTTVNPLLDIRSLLPVDDGQPHYGWLMYDPLTAALEFIIDGQNADDPAYPGRIVATGTVRSGTGSTLTTGNYPAIARFWSGQLGAFGYKQTNLLNWQDFMTQDGWPKPIDHSTWVQFIGQPPVWHESHDLRFNRGSAGNFTATGPVKLADPLDWQ